MAFGIRNSKAESRSEQERRARWKARIRAARSVTPISAAARAVGRGTRRSAAAVTTPKPPSAPMKSCFRSGPKLFFLSVVSPFQSVPSASATSSPSTWSRIMP